MRRPVDWHAAGLSERDVAPEKVYLNRRQFLEGAGLLAAGLAFPKLALAGRFDTSEEETPYDVITTYNNFYEFGSEKESPAKEAPGHLVTRPWTVRVGGLVRHPRVFSVDELVKLFAPEQRIYRMRCVEAWSIVVPWDGFALSSLLKKVEPTAKAKFVAFQTFFDPKMSEWQKTDLLPWPYVEGLRLDEAMHPLTILATGLYGKPLPAQDGAPIRLVVPWKYGFKGIKSIVKITLVDRQPPTTWNEVNPTEYGFYSNVNPNVDHPRWSQKTERRLGEFRRRKTLMFNGYGDQVAHLYKGMDLVKNF